MGLIPSLGELAPQKVVGSILSCDLLYYLVGPVPEPGHLRSAGLSQSPRKEVPRRYLRQNRLAGLERHNGKLGRPASSVWRCADRCEIP